MRKLDILGKRIRIIAMDGEPSYTGRTGIVMHVDGIGQLHGTWGSLAVIRGTDEYEIIGDTEQ